MAKLRSLAAATVLAAASAFAYEDGDWQLWLKGSLSGKLGQKASVKFDQEVRYGDDFSEFYNEESFLLLENRLNDAVKIGLGYRWVVERQNKTAWEGGTETESIGPGGEKIRQLTGYKPLGDGDHYWRQEERPSAEIVLSHKLAGWDLEDRFRVEYRMKDDGKDPYFRYRNLIRAKAPWEWTDWKVNPYVAWEVNYEDFDKAEHGKDPDFTRHRFYGGVGAKLTKVVRAGLYYCLQRDLDQKENRWVDANVIGLDLSASF